MIRPFQLNSVIAFYTWCVSFYLAWPHAVYAVDSGSFASDVRGYDVESLMWAVIMSLLGGGLRTIFTLATDDKLVLSFGRETVKDGIVATIAGMLAYIVMEALRSFKALPISSEIRFAVIVFAGWSRMSFFGWLNRLGTKVTDSVNERISTTIAGGGGTIKKPDDPGGTDKPPAPKPPPFKEITK
jgi:hypothetical protein